MTDKATIDPRLLKLISSLAQADAREDHERRLIGLPPLTADSLTKKARKRKESDHQTTIQWHFVPKHDDGGQ
ncbi:hypothetical protein EDF68_104158 [Ochrobactrum sp. BH3]|nr:hypothetical protein EDF68_104158 [Ochrobactrum sp. BH3]